MQLLLVDGTGAPAHRAGVVAVWHEAFGPIEDEAVWTEQVFDRHRARDDYRLALALEEDRVVGFSWGYTGERGQFWSDLVLRELGSTAEPWIGGHFEFVELAVANTARGRGIGGGLHDLLLSGVRHERAVLGTVAADDDPAPRLYRSRGWRRLGLLNEGRDQVMVLREPGRAPRH